VNMVMNGVPQNLGNFFTILTTISFPKNDFVHVGSLSSKSKAVSLHAVEAHGGEKVWLLLILNLDTRWGVSGQHHAPAALNPRGRTPGTHWTGGWVGPRAGLDTETRRKILCVCWGSNPGRPVRSQSLY
jgi:hypothetical protein